MPVLYLFHDRDSKQCGREIFENYIQLEPASLHASDKIALGMKAVSNRPYTHVSVPFGCLGKLHNV